jgi:hypothetical protein
MGAMGAIAVSGAPLVVVGAGGGPPSDREAMDAMVREWERLTALEPDGPSGNWMGFCFGDSVSVISWERGIETARKIATEHADFVEPVRALLAAKREPRTLHFVVMKRVPQGTSVNFGKIRALFFDKGGSA